jgi:hypothetical protein
VDGGRNNDRYSDQGGEEEEWRPCRCQPWRH